MDFKSQTLIPLCNLSLEGATVLILPVLWLVQTCQLVQAGQFRQEEPRNLLHSTHPLCKNCHSKVSLLLSRVLLSYQVVLKYTESCWAWQKQLLLHPQCSCCQDISKECWKVQISSGLDHMGLSLQQGDPGPACCMYLHLQCALLREDLLLRPGDRPRYQCSHF